MSKLIYLYIKNIDRKIFNQDINFSKDFDVSFENENLDIKEKDEIDEFWDEGIENCTLILGKNGVGKTSILDLLGLNEKTRKLNFDKGQYFLIYHIQDNIFYFVGTMGRLIGNLKNSSSERKNFYFELKDGSLRVLNSHSFTGSIETYYVRNKSTIPWAAEKKIYQGNPNKVVKHHHPTSDFKDVLKLYGEFKLFENENRSIKVEQKLYYLNNPRYLSFLYCVEDNSIDVNSNNLLFLSNAGMKKIEGSYKFFTRTSQDNLFAQHMKKHYGSNEGLKQYFILRLLEKIYMKYVFDIYNSNKISKEFKFEYIKRILNYSIMSRNALNVTNGNFFDLEERIDFLLDIIQIIEKMDISKKILNISNINRLYDILEILPERYFRDKNHLVILGEDLEFSSEISVLQDIYSNLFSLKFMNFSDGELIYLNVFSTMSRAISNSKNKDCILLLDEPDINLHPEWSRRLMFDMFRLIKHHKSSGNVQLIITSHSPFIVTDFPKDNIYSFKKNNNKYEIINPDFGFAANIYDVISNTMFLDSPIGEFAVEKIKHIQENPRAESANEIIKKIDDTFLKNILIRKNSKDDENK